MHHGSDPHGASKITSTSHSWVWRQRAVRCAISIYFRYFHPRQRRKYRKPAESKHPRNHAVIRARIYRLFLCEANRLAVAFAVRLAVGFVVGFAVGGGRLCRILYCMVGRAGGGGGEDLGTDMALGGSR